MENHQVTSVEIKAFQDLIDAASTFLKKRRQPELIETVEWKALEQATSEATKASTAVNTQS